MEADMMSMLDAMEAMERKLLGIEAMVSFMEIAFDVLHTEENNYEVSAVRSLHDYLMALRKEDMESIIECLRNKVIDEHV